MSIILDIDHKKLDGKTQLTWTNPSADTIDYLLFHLYYNAFKSSNSTFMKERGVPDFLTSDIDETCGWGWSEITLFKDQNGEDLTETMSYIQPDDDNKKDQTVLKIPLKTAVKPNQTVSFNFEWSAKIPKTMPRTGYNMDYYFFAQWFPKLGVYEPTGMRYATEGNWNCHQYHSAGEYYADFGNYDVKLTVPNNYIVAATGQLKSQDVQEESTTWQFAQEDIIDFTWSASPHYEVTRSNYKDTQIQVYSYPEKKHFAQRYIDVLLHAMAYLEEHLGPYPYPTLSVVDPPLHGIFTGGMEYPTIITTLSSNLFPKGIKIPETLVVHEYIHQYFMQMIATNETEEAWMDEGFTTYYESRILNSFMTEQTSTVEWLGFNAGNKEWNRAEFLGFDKKELAPNTLMSWEYTEGTYGPIAYNKTALWLQTMEGIIGTATMDEIMRTYFQTWKFQHPCREDFVNIANSITAKNHPTKYPDGLDWYFDQVLYGTALCDYAVESIKNEAAIPQRGFINTNTNCEVLDAKENIRSEILVCRLEEMWLPVELTVSYEDGRSEVLNWDGKDKCHTFIINGTQKVVSAEVDIDKKYYLDKNFLNNSVLIDNRNTGVRQLFTRMLTTVQHFFETVAIFI